MKATSPGPTSIGSPPSGVIVATVGREEAEEGLLTCLANGADRAIRIDAQQLSDPDPLAVATALAALARREQPDLVLCGVQSTDGAHAVTGIALAGLLELAHVAVVKAIELDGGQITVERELEGGAVEVLRVATPALLTVQTGINEPRYATLRAIKQARNKPLQTLALSELELDAATLDGVRGARVRALAERDASAGATMIDGSPQEIATRILEIIGESNG